MEYRKTLCFHSNVIAASRLTCTRRNASQSIPPDPSHDSLRIDSSLDTSEQPLLSSQLSRSAVAKRSKHHENIRPTIPVAIVPAQLLEPKAEDAMFDAWLNLSQREKATVFVMVRISAMTGNREEGKSA